MSVRVPKIIRSDRAVVGLGKMWNSLFFFFFFFNFLSALFNEALTCWMSMMNEWIWITSGTLKTRTKVLCDKHCPVSPYFPQNHYWLAMINKFFSTRNSQRGKIRTNALKLTVSQSPFSSYCMEPECSLLCSQIACHLSVIWAGWIQSTSTYAIALSVYVYRFQNVFLRCTTPRLHCFLSCHWPSFRFLSFMASLYLPSSFSSVFLVLSFVSASTLML